MVNGRFATFLSRLILALSIVWVTPLWATGSSCADAVKAKQSHLQQQYEREFLKFSKSAQEEWNRELLQEINSIENDLSRGPQKWTLLQRLGFKKVLGRIESPSYQEFVDNYIKLANEIFGPGQAPILPGVVMTRSTRVQGPGQRTTGVFESDIILITPGVDPWPTGEGYRIVSANELFNLPYRAVLNGLKSGRFPLMEASHDVYHFISFLMNPSYTKLLFENVRKAEAEVYPIGFGRRLFYLLELISLPDPAKRKELAQFLLFPKRQKFEKYQDFFAKQTTEQVISHAQKLIAGLQSFYIDYGGGMSRSYEKHQLLNTDFEIGVRNQIEANVLFHFYGNPRKDNASLTSDQVSAVQLRILENLLKMRSLSAEEFKPIASSNMYFRPAFIITTEASPDGSEKRQLRDDYQQTIDHLIRLQVARLEYFTWMNATQFTIEKWMNHGLVLQVSKDPLFDQMLADSFGPRSNLPKFFK